MRILVAIESVDFRRGIDGLARLCRIELKTDPLCDHVFIFRNKSRTAIKILTYDGQGFWICHKRFIGEWTQSLVAVKRIGLGYKKLNLLFGKKYGFLRRWRTLKRCFEGTCVRGSIVLIQAVNFRALVSRRDHVAFWTFFGYNAQRRASFVVINSAPSFSRKSTKYPRVCDGS
jgi:hypothetical protein